MDVCKKESIWLSNFVYASSSIESRLIVEKKKKEEKQNNPLLHMYNSVTIDIPVPIPKLVYVSASLIVFTFVNKVSSSRNVDNR